MDNTPLRAVHEIEHGKLLTQGDVERIWGWGTQAGQIRARRCADLIATAAELQPGMRVLEIGCGTGLFTEMFADYGAGLVAVDISSDLLERARSRGLPDDRVQFLHMRFEDFEGEVFDAIIGSSILHHLEIDIALSKIFGLLKPGGVMSFAEPNMLNPEIMVRKNVPFLKRRFGESPDETAFFRWRFGWMLRRKGFEQIEITPYDWLHPATPPVLIPVVLAVGRYLEKIPIVREISGSLYIRARRPKLTSA